MSIFVKGFRNDIFRQYSSYKPIKRPNLTNSIKKTAPNVDNVDKPNEKLFNQLRSKILATGPLTVADYMREVLTNPIAGYYMNRDVFGAQGDFITSPEIGQIFGELVAIWCIAEWQKLGSPKPLQIVELGPGRGTLSKDILKVLSHFKVGSQLSFHLVEISPYLSKIQAHGLCFRHEEIDDADQEKLFYRWGETLSGAKVYWYRRIEDVPMKFSIVLAHEFFDALPVHKLQKDKGVWKEILVDIDIKNERSLRFVLSKSQTPISQLFKADEGDTRECLEYSPQSCSLITKLADIFETVGGFGLIMDYGHFGDKTDTFRAFKEHKLHDPLLEPGTADLTADVDFKQLKTVAEETGKLVTFGPVEQGSFLKKMEGEARLKILLNNATPEQQIHILSGYQMLTDPQQMGSRFKFFSLFPAILREHLRKFPVSGFTFN